MIVPVVVSEFIVAYNMVRQDLARPKSVPPTPIDMTPNMTNGKYFVGKKVPTRFYLCRSLLLSNCCLINLLLPFIFCNNVKHFEGEMLQGGGRYRTVEVASEQEGAPSGRITCDMFEDGLFVYQYEASHGN